MPRVSPENMLVLCLDVDQTWVDYDSGQCVDASIWFDLIKKTYSHCIEHRIGFVLQVITEKSYEDTDDTVNRIVKYLSSVLEQTPNGYAPEIRLYANFEVQDASFLSPMRDDELDCSLVMDEDHTEDLDTLLPAIHIFFGSYPSNADVMHWLSEYLGGAPAENMFFLDDGLGLIELESRLIARVADIVNVRASIYGVLIRYDKPVDEFIPSVIQRALPSPRFFTSTTVGQCARPCEEIRSFFTCRDEFAQCLARLIDDVIIEKTAIRGDENNLTFGSVSLPAISIKDYIIHCVTHLKISDEDPDHYESTFVLMCIYVDRYLKRNPMDYLCSFYSHRLFFCGLLLGHKMNDDDFLHDTYAARLGGVSIGELKELELEFLQKIEWDIVVSVEEFDCYHGLLNAYHANFRAVNAMIETPQTFSSRHGERREGYVP